MTATIDTALTLRLEATLSKFEKQMARARKVGTDTVTGLQNRFKRSNDGMARSAEQSANAIAREMDRLRAKYDPVFAASKRYESALDELNRAHKAGAIDARTYDAALDRLNVQYARMAVRTGRAVKANKRLATVSRGTGGGIQNVAFQIGDFATQVGAGTSASIALGQQLPQLLGGFGALGAVMGAAVAIAVPLGAALMNTAEDAASLEERLDDLRGALRDYTQAVREADAPVEELIEKYGRATAAAGAFLDKLRESAAFEAEQLLQSQLTGIADQFGGFDRANDDPLGIGSAFEATMQRIGDQLDASAEQVLEFVDDLEALRHAEGPEQAVEATRELLAALEEAFGAFEQMPPEARRLYTETTAAGEAAAQLQGAADQAAKAIAGASSEAEQLVINLGAAVAQMRALSNARIADSRRRQEAARIDLETVGQPVERAGRRAVADFRHDLDDGGYRLIAGGRASQLAGQETLVRQAAEEAARLSEAARAADSEYSKLQRSLGNSSARKIREFDPFSLGENTILAMERSLELLGKTSREMTELRARYAMLDEAKRRDIDLNQRSAETGLTVAETIDQNARKVADLTEAYEHAADRAAFFDDIQGDLKEGIVEAIVEGENFAGVLEDIAKSFAKAALEAALFNSGPLGSGGAGQGLLGGLFGGLGALFGGFFADGGYLGAGKWGIAGERGPEAIVGPAQVVPLTGRSAATGASGMHITVGIASDGALNIMPEVVSVSQQEAQGAAAAVASAVPAMVDGRLNQRETRRIRPQTGLV